MKLKDFLNIIDIERLIIAIDSKTLCACDSDSPVLKHYEELEIEEVRPIYSERTMKIFLKNNAHEIGNHAR